MVSGTPKLSHPSMHTASRPNHDSVGLALLLVWLRASAKTCTLDILTTIVV